MKIGDLVTLRGSSVFSYGVVLDSYESDDGIIYHEVQWVADDRMWYDEIELKILSESS